MAEVSIGGRPVGDGHPVFIIAEAGSNHDGKLSQAFQLVDVAAAAGADAVKFQTFRAASLYARTAGTSDYLATSKPIFELIREMEMPLEWLPDLAEHCREKGLIFLSTPFDEEMANALDPLVPAFKIDSYSTAHVRRNLSSCRRGQRPAPKSPRPSRPFVSPATTS